MPINEFQSLPEEVKTDVQKKQESEKEEILRQAFEIWSSQQTTHLIIQAMREYRKTFVDSIVATVNNPSITDQQFRFNAVGLKTWEAAITVMTDFETFKKLLTNKQ